MNRYHLLGTQVDTAGQEWAFLFDETSGRTYKSPVQTLGAPAREVERVITPFVPPTGKPLFAPHMNGSTEQKTPPERHVGAIPEGYMLTEDGELRPKKIPSSVVPPQFREVMDKPKDLT